MTLTRRHFLALSAATLTARPAFASDPQVPEEEVLPRALFGRSSQSLSPAVVSGL